ncbi:MAG: hypothetical protein AB8E15_05265 [Bdellovibrionales bacterium]
MTKLKTFTKIVASAAILLSGAETFAKVERSPIRGNGYGQVTKQKAVADLYDGSYSRRGNVFLSDIFGHLGRRITVHKVVVRASSARGRGSVSLGGDHFGNSQNLGTHNSKVVFHTNTKLRNLSLNFRGRISIDKVRIVYSRMGRGHGGNRPMHKYLGQLLQNERLPLKRLFQLGNKHGQLATVVVRASAANYRSGGSLNLIVGNHSVGHSQYVDRYSRDISFQIPYYQGDLQSMGRLQLSVNGSVMVESVTLHFQGRSQVMLPPRDRHKQPRQPRRPRLR